MLPLYITVMKKIPAAYTQKFFYHFTHIDNLESILQHGLLCTNEKTASGINHANVALAEIQQRRSKMQVSCGPQGNVHDYVPFYLCQRNPMFLHILNTKNIDMCDIIFLTIDISRITENDVVFCNASANTDMPPDFFSDPKDLDQLDWTAIDANSWSPKDDDERHRRMAEVLIYKKVEVDEITKIFVCNDRAKTKVLEIFSKTQRKAPNISMANSRNGENFYYTKFMLNRNSEPLITGPKGLRARYHTAVKTILQERTHNTEREYKFKNIADCLKKLSKNFSAIKELDDIYGLKTDNLMHRETVSDHTLNVVRELEKLDYFKKASRSVQEVLKLSAYLHDIGKGPKSMWKDGIQKVYPDHPADGPKMLTRILVEDFEELTDYEIRMICLLVTYHDLIGEIIEKGRDIQQLIHIIENQHDLEMLETLNYADVSAINKTWAHNFKSNVKKIRSEALKKFI